jgi:hypothetical protein
MSSSSSKKPQMMIKLSKTMQYILQQEALSKGIDTSLLKGNEFSHAIIKEARNDERMYLASMVKRLLYCCPLPFEQQNKEVI